MTAYSKVYNVEGSGQTLNQRTLGMYKQVKDVYNVLGGTGYIFIYQGSYSTAVSASGNTHAGGGAIDFGLSVPTDHNWAILEKAARMCMFADWNRPTLVRNGVTVWKHHNHGIAIGDKTVSPSAANQVHYYYADEDGLVTHYHDTHWKPRVLFSPVYPLHHVNLAAVKREAKKNSGWIPLPGVVRIQKALNKKLGTTLRVNGRFNAKTKAAYARWEKTVGGDGNGVPGEYSLVLLGAGRFNVKR
jgi:hypothetical protein